MQQSDSFVISPIGPALRGILQPMINAAWYGPLIAVNSRIWNTETMPGFAALDEHDEILGYLLYAMHDNACEIMALESLRENRGVGTGLIRAVKDAAKANGLRQLIVTTTNDNLRAIRFYQRRGFALQALRPNILEQSRKLKPSIPLMGMDGIPLRDELEFSLNL